jgi:hypothetical protein
MHFAVRTLNDVPLPDAIPVRIVTFVNSDSILVPTEPLEAGDEAATEADFTQEIQCDAFGCAITVEVDPDEALGDPNYANNTATYPDVE